MSSNSFAALRRHAGSDLANLAEEHFKHEYVVGQTRTNVSLTQSDRDTLTSAATSVGTFAAVGSIIGLGLGGLLAFRLRAARRHVFAAIRASEKPTHVQFASGRTEPIPDVTPYLAPSRVGDVLTYTLFGFGGLFVFGELGALGGAWQARRTISADPDRRVRIEAAFRRFRADVLRREADALEKGIPAAVGSGFDHTAGGLLD